MLVVLNPHSDGVVITENELIDMVANIELYRSNFENLFRAVICAYSKACHDPESAKAFQPLVEWMRHHYIELRGHLPADLKRLYLQGIAFPVQNDES
jgi:hypothetical protein